MRFIYALLLMGILTPAISSAQLKVCGENWYAQNGHPPDSRYGKVKEACISIDRNDKWEVEVRFMDGERVIYPVIFRENRRDFRERNYTYIEIADPKNLSKKENGFVRYMDDSKVIESFLGASTDGFDFICMRFHPAAD